MKKTAAILLFVASCGSAFGEAYFQYGAGIMYLSYPTAQGSAAFNCRAGMTGDLLFSLGRLEIGVEIGLFALPMDFVFFSFVLFDMPFDILARANLSPDRNLAFELHAGMWLKSYTLTVFEEAGTASDSTLHAGGRFVLGWFYIGADYITQSQFFHPVLVFEVGVKGSARIGR
jgi:hypothetical protein